MTDFTEGYYQKYSNEIKSLSFVERVHWSLATRTSLVGIEWSLLAQVPQKGRVLDIACATGRSLLAYHRRRPDLDCYGIDIGEVQDQIPPFINFTKGDAQKMPYENEFFDFIIMRHFLEHLCYDDVVRVLREAYRVLKKGGKLFVLSPNEDTLLKVGEYNFFSDPTHVRPMTEFAFRKLCKILDMQLVLTKKKNWTVCMVVTK